VKQFKYLGYYTSFDLKDDYNIDKSSSSQQVNGIPETFLEQSLCQPESKATHFSGNASQPTSMGL
jgi:hypothetical protein